MRNLSVVVVVVVVVPAGKTSKSQKRRESMKTFLILISVLIGITGCKKYDSGRNTYKLQPIQQLEYELLPVTPHLQSVFGSYLDIHLDNTFTSSLHEGKYELLDNLYIRFYKDHSTFDYTYKFVLEGSKTVIFYPYKHGTRLYSPLLQNTESYLVYKYGSSSHELAGKGFVLDQTHKEVQRHFRQIFNSPYQGFDCIIKFTQDTSYLIYKDSEKPDAIIGLPVYVNDAHKLFHINVGYQQYSFQYNIIGQDLIFTPINQRYNYTIKVRI